MGRARVAESIKTIALGHVTPQLLLASNSPRRRDLLVKAGFKFESVPPDVGERFDSHLTIRELTLWNALRKGIAVARLHPHRVVLAADTLVGIEHRVLSKPRDRAEALRMLKRLNGRLHQVCSAVFICHLSAAKMTSFCEVSRVHFRKLSDAALRRYLEQINPIDKAGGYAAQHSGTEIIREIRGSSSNVVGLPMERTIRELARFGVKPTRHSTTA
jgi:septum formation protein